MSGVTVVFTGQTASITIPVGWSRIDIIVYNGGGPSQFIWTGSKLSSTVATMIATPWFGDDAIPYNGNTLTTNHNTLDDGHGNTTVAGNITINGTPSASNHAINKGYIDNSIQHLANNAHNVNDPVDRYPSSWSFFGLIGSNYSGFPFFGTVTTYSGSGDNPSLFPYQTFMSTNGTMTDVRYRRALSTAKPAWAVNASYSANTIVMPTSANENGHYYKVITAGTGTGTEPSWPTGTGVSVYEYGGASAWAASTAYAVNALVIPTTANAFYYKTTTAGTSSTVQPTWPTTAGSTVKDTGNAGTWAASTSYSVGTFVVPATSNGMYYKCTTAGKSAPVAPTWSTTSGATMNDNGGASAWTANYSYALNNTVIPTTANGYYYQCTTAGMSSGLQPTWPTTEGATVSDTNNALSWTASTAYAVGNSVVPTTGNGLYYTCTTAGTSGTAAPTWPTTEGATVTDGGVTWTAHVISVWTAHVTPVWTAYVSPVWTAYQAPQWQEAGTFWSPWQSNLVDDGAGNVNVSNNITVNNQVVMKASGSTHSMSLQFNSSTNSLDVIFS